MKKSEMLQKIEEWLEELAARVGVVFIDAELVRESGNDFLRVYIDRAGGVRMEDCEAISRELGSRLDDLDLIPGAYTLEVSSPGLERSLKKDREFRHFAGRRVDVTLFTPVEQGRKFSGTLLGIEDGAVSFRRDDGQTIVVPREKVARTALILELPEGGKRR